MIINCKEANFEYLLDLSKWICITKRANEDIEVTFVTHKEVFETNHKSYNKVRMFYDEQKGMSI